MTASRLIEPLTSWRRYVPQLGEQMRGQLDRIAGAEGLSKNVGELVGKALA